MLPEHSGRLVNSLSSLNTHPEIYDYRVESVSCRLMPIGSNEVIVLQILAKLGSISNGALLSHTMVKRYMSV